MSESGEISVSEKHFVWPFGCGKEGSECLIQDMAFIPPPEEFVIDVAGQSHVAVLYVDASDPGTQHTHIQCALLDFSQEMVRPGPWWLKNVHPGSRSLLPLPALRGVCLMADVCVTLYTHTGPKGSATLTSPIMAACLLEECELLLSSDDGTLSTLAYSDPNKPILRALSDNEGAKGLQGPRDLTHISGGLTLMVSSAGNSELRLVSSSEVSFMRL